MANNHQDEADFCRKLLQVGRRYAARRGLIREDGEDCAGGFVLHVLTLLHALASEEEPAAATLAAQDPAWLHRQARAYVRNFQRTVLTHSHRYSSLARSDTQEDSKEPASHEEPVSRMVRGSVTLLRAEFWQHIFAALDNLAPVPRQLLIGRQLQGESIETLAAACERSCHAAEQTLLRARKQMRQALERHGCGEAVLREYVAAFAPDHVPFRSAIHVVWLDEN